MKRCVRCDVPKSLEDFHKDSSKADGRYPVCKTCRKPVTKNYYADNKPVVRAKQRAAHAASPKKYREASRQFRVANPEYMKTYSAQYYQDHKDRWKEWGRTRDKEAVRKQRAIYVAANREKLREGVRDWVRRNPHAARLNGVSYRLRRKSVENTLTAEQIDETLEIFDNRCGYCLVNLEDLPPSKRTLDHIEAIVRGGNNTQENNHSLL